MTGIEGFFGLEVLHAVGWYLKVLMVCTLNVIAVFGLVCCIIIFKLKNW